MRRGLKFIGWVVGVVAGVLILLVAYFFWKYPDVDRPPVMKVEASPERLARGKYLANHVTVCIDCHSERNWTLYSGPIIPGTEGKGGFRFGKEFGFPGSIYARNITPSGIGSMTDGELFRAITSGVRKNGQAMFPIMPYPSFNKLSDEDLYSIIAYIRTLKPVESTIPETELDFPVNFIVRTIPTRHSPVQAPDPSNLYEYGKYLVNAAACSDCHSQQVKGEVVKGLEFAGGMEFPFPEGIVRSANITPDEDTGIGSWTLDNFVERFKHYAAADTATLEAEASLHNSFMPWVMFSGMTDQDLTAIYKHLRTLPPVKNKVEKFTAKGE